MKLSAPEQRLLEFAQERFGECLSQFLLAGLGEETADQSWHFTIKYICEKGIVLNRRIKTITFEPLDGSSFLPRFRDPLVLIALLYLLLNGKQETPNSLRYEQEDVLSLLRWKNTRKVSKEIDQAVERYSMLSYKWEMNRSELDNMSLKFFTANETIISKCQSVNEKDGESRRLLYHVVFNEYFIEQLLSRSVFGVNWDTVRSIAR